MLGDAGVDPGAVTRFVHGTTLATNVILQRSGGPVALVTTEGFGDLLRLGREARVEEDRYDLFFTPAPPPVDARLHLRGARARRRHRRDAVVALDRCRDRRGRRRRSWPRTPVGVAVCLLHSYANPDHEQRVAARPARRAARRPTSCARRDVWPEMREYERAMTTVISALVAPVMAELPRRPRRSAWASSASRCPIQIMDSSGGVMTRGDARATRR